MAIVVNVLLGILGVAIVVANIVMWLISLIQSITRDDLKNHRALWIILILFVAPIGSLMYFFMEKRKKYGWIYLALALALPVLFAVYAIVAFSFALQY